MKIGYIRASTKVQELGLEAQTQKLLDYGVSEEHIFIDRGTSGKNNAHSEVMAKLMTFVEEQNKAVEVVVSKLDRWGRNHRDVEDGIVVLSKIGGSFTSLSEGITQATTDNIVGMLIIRIMGAISQMERERIAERTQESLEALRKRGVPLGPPPKLTSRDVEWIKDKHELEGWGAQRITKALPLERNVQVSKRIVLRVLGMDKNARPYVPKDNLKYVKREEARAAKVSGAAEEERAAA